MSYRILFPSRALNEFGQLPGNDYETVRDVIVNLGLEPRPAGCLRVVGRDGWHIRAGNYRVVYEVDDNNQSVTILHIGRRKNIIS
jgi:mRNA interferase RelE/StbE